MEHVKKPAVSPGNMEIDYYSRPEVSNSDLSALAKYWQDFQISYDIDSALRFGTLFDAMLTEPQKIDFFKFSCAGWVYTRDEFALAEMMKKVFNRDEYCRLLLQKSELQKVTVNLQMAFNHLGLRFTLPFRGKADFDATRILGTIADLKSTTATTEKDFRKMIEAFSYDRQAAAYMDLPVKPVDKFVILGVSKKPPHPIFKVPIARGDALYLSGREKLDRMAFRHFQLFAHLKIAA